MASGKNIELTIGVKTGGGSEVKKLTLDLEALRDITKEVKEAAKDINEDRFVSAATTTAVQNAISAIEVLRGLITDLSDAYSTQIEAETQLAVNMRNTMAATDEEIASIKELCSAQQEIGVVGDEVQLAGAQELATYLSMSDTLKELIPVMNDMIVQQYGLGASGENAVNIATMMGKVMDGQTGALKRYGYSFTEAQEQILKFGEESERAAVLAEVISSRPDNARVEDSPCV